MNFNTYLWKQNERVCLLCSLLFHLTAYEQSDFICCLALPYILLFSLLLCFPHSCFCVCLTWYMWTFFFFFFYYVCYICSISIRFARHANMHTTVLKWWPAAVNAALDAATKITATNHGPWVWMDYTLLLWHSNTAVREEDALQWLVQQQDNPSITPQ